MAGYLSAATGNQSVALPAREATHTEMMSSQKRRPAGAPPRAIVEDVEPRILYSADAGVLAYAPTQEVADAVQVQFAESQSAVAEQQAEQVTNRLVVLDDSLPDLQLLVDDLEQQRDQGASVHVLLIDANADGLTQVTQFLQSTSEQFTELHIVSHGDDAQFELGNVTVDESLVRARASDFASWDVALADGADLLIYGCDFSSSDQGVMLASSLGVLTGADVASSIDDTGHASLDANWTLESATGPVQATQLFSDITVNSWTHELAVLPGPEVGNPGALQVDTPGADNPTLDSQAGSRQVATDGNITVIVWELEDEIYYRVVSFDGLTAGAVTAIQNDPGDPAYRYGPAVAIDPTTSNFMITWISNGQDNNGGTGGANGVYAQRFDSTGAALARPGDAYAEIGGAGNEYVNPHEFRVNPHGSGTVFDSEAWNQIDPSIAGTPDGGFYVSWTSEEQVFGTVAIDEIRLTRYQANGTRDATVDSVLVYPTPAFDMGHSSLAVNASGDLYLASEIDRLTGETIEVHSVDSVTGLSTGTLATIDPASNNASRPRLAVNDSGQWALAARWNSNETHFYHGDIGSTNPEIPNSTATNSLSADIAIRENGNVVLVRQQENWSDASSGQDINVVEFLPTGELSVRYAVHSHDPGVQQNPGLVLHGNTAAIIWDGAGASDGQGIFLHNMAVVDSAAVLVPSATTTDESGSQVNVAVTLNAPPTGTATVTATVTNTTEGQVFGSSTATFDETNWDTAQTIVIRGVADGIVDPDVDYDIDFSFTGSSSGLFQFAPTQTLTFTNQNTDVPTVFDADADPRSVAENAAPGTTIEATVATNVPGTTFAIDPLSSSAAIFSIGANSGIITVADSTALDAESNLPNPASVDIPVIATSGAWSQTQVFSVAISDVNDELPVITAASYSIDEGQTGQLSPLMIATDQDITPTVFSWSVSAPAPYDTGYVSINSTTGELSVDTAFDFEDPNLPLSNQVPLTVSVSDGVNPATAVTVNLTIVDVADATPVITSTGALTVLENDTAFSAQMTATDTDTLPANLVWSSTGGSAAPYFAISATGEVTMTSAFDYDTIGTTSLQLDIAVSDGPHSDTHALVINLTGVNDESPTITTGQIFTVSESALNASLVGTIAQNDADLGSVNPAPSFTLVSTMSGGVSVAPPFSVLTSGLIRVTDNSQLDYDNYTTYQLQVQVTDGLNPPTVGTVVVNVTDQNSQPTGADRTVTIVEDSTFKPDSTEFPFSDPDSGDTLAAIEIISVPATGQLSVNTLNLDASNTSIGTPQVVSVAQLDNFELSFTPAQDSTTQRSFDYYVVDQAGARSATVHTMTFTITPENDAPTYPDGPTGVTAVPENTPVLDMINVFDVDDPVASLTYQILPVGDSNLFTIDSGGNVSFGAQDFENPIDQGQDNGYEFTVRATDPHGAYSDQSWTLNITDVQDWLYFNPTTNISTPEDTAVDIGPGALVLSDALTSNSLTVTLEAAAKITLGSTAGLTFQTGDGTSDNLMTFTGNAGDVNAAITLLTVTPAANVNGAITIDASVTDPLGRTDSTTLTVNVTPVNDAPQIDGSAQINAMVGSSVTVTSTMLIASDVEDAAQDLNYTVVSNPPSGQLLVNGVALAPGATFTEAQLAAGQVIFESLARVDSIEQFTVEVRDSGGATDTREVNVTTSGGLVATTPTDDGGSSTSQSNEPADSPAESTNPVTSSPPDESSTDASQPASPSVTESGDSVTDEAREGAADESRPKPQIILAYKISYASTDYEGYRVSELQTKYESVSQSGDTRARPDFGFGGKFEMTDFRQSMQALDESRERFGVRLDRQFVASTTVVSTGMSIGYVLWLMRGGALLSSIIASMPAWRSIDPLPVLASLGSADDGQAEDDSLEAMLEKSPPTESADADAQVEEETQ